MHARDLAVPCPAAPRIDLDIDVARPLASHDLAELSFVDVLGAPIRGRDVSLAINQAVKA